MLPPRDPQAQFLHFVICEERFDLPSHLYEELDLWVGVSHLLEQLHDADVLTWRVVNEVPMPFGLPELEALAHDVKRLTTYVGRLLCSLQEVPQGQMVIVVGHLTHVWLLIDAGHEQTPACRASRVERQNIWQAVILEGCRG